jgi:hypothetical protein
VALRLLVDEDMASKALVGLLRQHGHDIRTAGEAGLLASPDGDVIQLAYEEGRVLLTGNGADFALLHRDGTQHAGVLAVYRDRDPSKDMSRRDIARALANVEAAGMDLHGQFVALNDWRY